MTCLPRIMFPDAVARFRAIQTCYFYPRVRIRFTWTHGFAAAVTKCTDDTNTQIDFASVFISAHMLTETDTYPDTHITK